MERFSNVSLQTYSTFHVPSIAKTIVHIKNSKEVPQASQLISEHDRYLILGSGSNVLFATDYFDGLIIHNSITGYEILESDDEHVTISVGAGVPWHNFVKWTVGRSFYGAENLALIPGTVGAAPVQNIGAYGAELSNIFDQLTAFDFKKEEWTTITKEQAQFGYRDSVFKQHRNRYFITSVQFRLSKTGFTPNINYNALQEYLDDQGIEQPTQDQLFKSIVAIRSSKLPDPQSIGNGGSFFKNPIVTNAKFEQLKKEFLEIPSYKISNVSVKIPAAWLIDQCGWKGHRRGDIGVYNKQALVLVNYNHAKGGELLKLARDIQTSVLEKYGIQLVPEITIIE